MYHMMKDLHPDHSMENYYLQALARHFHPFLEFDEVFSCGLIDSETVSVGRGALVSYSLSCDDVYSLS